MASGLRTTTSRAPAVPAGELAVSCVALTKATLVAAVPPTVTVAPETNPVPVSVIVVPPAVGPLFGETAVLYNGQRSATIKATTDVLTVRLPGPVFLELLHANPDLAVRVAVILAQRLASDRHVLASDPTITDME